MVVTTAWARPQNGLAEKQGQQNKRKDGGHGATEIKRTTAGSPCAWRCRLRRNVKRVLGEGSQAGPTDPAVRFLEIPGGASRSMAARSCLVVAAWGPPGGIGWGLHGLGLAAHWLPVGCSLAVRWQLTGQWPPHKGPSSLPLPLARECSVGEFSQFQVEPPASYREPAIRADGANGRPAFSSLCIVSSAEAPVQANCRPQPVLAVGVTCREGQSPTGLDLLRAACAHAGSRFPPVAWGEGLELGSRGVALWERRAMEQLVSRPSCWLRVRRV